MHGCLEDLEAFLFSSCSRYRVKLSYESAKDSGYGVASVTGILASCQVPGVLGTTFPFRQGLRSSTRPRIIE